MSPGVTQQQVAVAEVESPVVHYRVGPGDFTGGQLIVALISFGPVSARASATQ